MSAGCARRERDERGFVTVLMATLVASGLLLACAAIGVDTARWYAEIARVQKAADAAALAAVPFLPNDLPSAITRARQVAALNGYDDASPTVSVAVERGALASQLRVTITSRIDNDFGASFGVGSATITRSSVADYKGSAPMGSPCNTFGNEPAAGGGVSSPTPAGSALGAAPLANCSPVPQFWAGIQGQRTNKSNGDRFMNTYCTSTGTYGCSGSPVGNDETDARGYFWVIRVNQAAVNQPINLQLYDPAYVNTGDYTCASLPNYPTTTTAQANFPNALNSFVTDARRRYSDPATLPVAERPAVPFCNGDFRPAGYDSSTASNVPPTTTFVVREQTDSLDPMQAAPMVSQGCVKQYVGTSTVPTVNSLKETETTYNRHLAQVFHNWTSLCTFTPPRAGDYYLQVRTNVAAAGASESTNSNSLASRIYLGTSAAWAATGNTTTGVGINTFGIRAVPPAGLEKQVAVSGYDRMPIFANAPAASTFNLIRILPGAAGQYISFSFFDVADSAGTSGTVTVIPPADASGDVLTEPFPGGCRAEGGAAGSGTTYDDCVVPISSAANNGQLETLTIPIPADYTCDESTNGGCWYQVRVDIAGAVHDFTTWTATVVGDPVRLIE